MVHASRFRIAAVAALSIFVLALSGTAGAATSVGSSSAAGTRARAGHGTASVAYAGSLELLAETELQPKFEAATGDGFQGRAGGSSTLTQEILANEINPGVFMSVGKKNIKKLWPSGRAKFVIQLATDPLVVAYNPRSPFAPQFSAIASGRKPVSDLFTVLSSPGLHLGRTDPNADPQGVYFILMMMLAQSTLHLKFDPATTALGVTKSTPFGLPAQMVDEDSLITDLQAGDFDATSAYITQAIQYHLHYIKLPASLNFADAAESAHYATVKLTLTDGTVDTGDLITLNITLVLPSSPSTAPSVANQAADDAFVAWLLSPGGRSVLKRGGYPLTAPVFTGAATADTPSAVLPADVLSAFHAVAGKTSS